MLLHKKVQMPLVRYFAMFFFCLFVLCTKGQSLVMSGNEIFEQENIPRKKDKEKDKSLEKKFVKNKGEVKIPILKKDSTPPPNTSNKENKNNDSDRKPKINTAWQEKPTEISLSFAFEIVLDLLKLLYYSVV